MHRRLTFLLAFLLAINSAHAQSIDPAKVAGVRINITDTTDRFTGDRIIAAQKGIELEKTGFLVTLSVSPAVLAKEKAAPIFYVAVYYSAYGWAFLNGTAHFLVDGKRFTATGLDSSNHRKVLTCSSVGCINEELERLLISYDLAHAVANATSVEVKVTGSNGALTGRMNAKHIAYFREMIKRYEAIGGTYAGTDQSKPQEIRTAPDPGQQCEACKQIGRPLSDAPAKDN